ncbi:MAG TPA: NAD(P)H-dependent oxidoreductase subunit E [Phycisphaerae bacterium]|nr:NAD(P)H-dependent oxidoreductase subunit E [Phycisphaerae bacterium]
MSDLQSGIKEICASCGNDRTRMMDIIRAAKARWGCVGDEAIDLIARTVSVPRVEVESVVTFYAFFSKKPKGKVVVRLCNDIIDRMHGSARSAEAFIDDLGIGFGEVTPDGMISLESVPCIGLSDQAPGALINDVPVTHLTSDAAHDIVEDLKTHMDPQKLVKSFGDGNNSHPLVRSMVRNNIRLPGPIIFSRSIRGAAIKKAIGITPAEVIRAVKTSRLRGRGGAGFPTGIKWEFCRAADGEKKYVLCNADEGEPGTFKDRVVLTERPDLVFAGMTIAGYAIGAVEGIVYLRGEYAYLRAFLEDVLAKRRSDGLLGKDILGKKGYDFDIRIQMGAGAYVCGEETSLISSCEGLRGDPKNRPPFPAQKGYLGYPTVVNNVETFCCVARIMEDGPATFNEYGSAGSSGTKLLSISGDCTTPGVYEVRFGITLGEVLKFAGAEDAIAVQVGGPSGQLVGPKDYGRKICYDDLATGGSIMTFGPKRDVLKTAQCFMDFFIEESCGYCTPCRVGNVLLKERLERIMEGNGEPSDLDYLQQLGTTVKTASRCGLGQTSPNPILTSLANFRSHYEALVKPDKDGLKRAFDVKAAVHEAERIAGHASTIY